MFLDLFGLLSFFVSWFRFTLQVLDDMATMAYDKVVLGMGNEVR